MVLISAWPAGVALAHANLLGSTPETGQALGAAPQSVVLEYSEALDAEFSKVKLLDAGSQVVAGGPGRLDPADARILRLDLPALPDGVYSAVWQVRSTVDGHITSGSVSFSVGDVGAGLSLLPPPGTPDPATALPPLVETLLRWLNYLGASLSIGSALFALLAWRPSYRAWSDPVETADIQAGRLLRGLIQAGGVLMIVNTIAGLFYQALRASGGEFQASFWGSLLQLAGGHNGGLILARLAALGLMILLARRLPPAGSCPSRPWGEVAALGTGVLFTFSLQSHGAALGSPLAVASDWLHLVAMSAWMGGLLPLFLLLRRPSPPLSILVPKFSTVALASVAALALTGTYAAVIHIRTLDALAATTYGRALALKTGFFVLLLALGAANLFVISPRLADLRTWAARWLGRTVRTELLLGLLVLLAAALMTATPPALEALQAQRRQGLVGSVREGDVQMKLRVVPGITGVNEFGVDVAGISQDAGEPKPEVLLRLRMLDAAMGVTQVETQPQDNLRYTARGSYFPMPGQWQVEVILRRAGMDDIRHTFDVQVKPLEQEEALPNPVPADAASISAGEALYQANCLACHGPQGKGDGPVGLTLNPRPADLTQHTMPGVHPDGQLFEWISKGYPGSVMPAFEETLSEEERWHLVNYIRTLALEGEP